MASLVQARSAPAPLAGSAKVHSEFKTFARQPSRLVERVAALTRIGALFLGLLALAFFGWGMVKVLQWNRFGVLFFGWFDAVVGVMMLLVAGISWYNRRYRRVPEHGELYPARLFMREKKATLQLTADAGDFRARTAVAGHVPTGVGVSRLRLLSVEYEVNQKRFVGKGQLLPGDLPARVRIDEEPCFAVMCDPRRPGLAVLLTEYDYEAAPGEAG